MSTGRLVALKLRIVETASEPNRIVFGRDTEMILAKAPLTSKFAPTVTALEGPVNTGRDYVVDWR